MLKDDNVGFISIDDEKKKKKLLTLIKIFGKCVDYSRKCIKRCVIEGIECRLPQKKLLSSAIELIPAKDNCINPLKALKTHKQIQTTKKIQKLIAFTFCQQEKLLKTSNNSIKVS